MTDTDFLQQAVKEGALRPFDRHFARLMMSLGGDDPALGLAAALVSRHTSEGHVCMALSAHAGEGLPGMAAPELATWRRLLKESRVVGEPGDYTPLILDRADRLYLGRYWQFEHDLADRLMARGQLEPGIDRERLRQGLQRYFPHSETIDWQQVAAAMAVLRRFMVISGGPGTGKTWTVTVILALLAEQYERPLRMALTAPTGKAAARLAESIRAAKSALPLPTEVAVAIPEQCQTLHRLLGARPDGQFRHHADNPLPLDLLVVDEASMVDLPMMSRLLAALPLRARLILLGDRDQLASVEAGYVLGDICGPMEQPPLSREMTDLLQQLCGMGPTEPPATSAFPMTDSVMTLRKSRRFSHQGGIGRLALAVRRGDGLDALSVLQSGDEAVVWRQDAGLSGEMLLDGYLAYLKADSPQQALERFGHFRVLCAVREGPRGVARLNEQIERALAQGRWIRAAEPYYRGRPVMVTHNDYALGLFNGDVGLIWPDPTTGGLRAWFAGGDDGIRSVAPSRLPMHETVYAMTVHKSQGSEFDQVVLILPDEESPVLTRELLYTGITRARQRVWLHGCDAIVRSTLSHRVERHSALEERLWGDEPKKIN